MFDTNLFGEMDPTRGNALGSCVNSMVIWEAEEMCTHCASGSSAKRQTTRQTKGFVFFCQSVSKQYKYLKPDQLMFKITDADKKHEADTSQLAASTANPPTERLAI